MKETSQIGQVHFHYLVKPFYFPHRQAVKTFLLQQLRSAGKRVNTINYVFCDDQYLLIINEQYLRHTTYTDIITFELSESGHDLLADVFISVERVRENASLLKTSFKDELRRVVFHGALHLVGYKDKTSTEKHKMRSMEDAWLRKFNVSREIDSKKD